MPQQPDFIPDKTPDFIPDAPAEGPGFFGQLSQRVLGSQQPLTDLSTTADWLIHDPEKIKEGLKEYGKVTAKGLYELGKEALPYAGPLGMLVSPMPKPGDLKAVKAVTGVGDIADVPKLAKEGKYAEAAGAGAAGLVKALPLMPKLSRAGRATEVLESGERLPFTRGMVEPASKAGRMESVLSALPEGGPIRQAHTEISDLSQDFIRRTISDATQRAGGQIPLPKNIADAADVSSRIIRDQAGPLYKSVRTAMRGPRANFIDIRPIAVRAKGILDAEDTRSLLSKSDLDPTIKADMQKLAAYQSSFPGGPAEVYDATTTLRSRLLDQARSGKLNPNEARISRQIVRQLDTGILQALRGTNPQLARQWVRANRLTNQGYAMKEVSDILRPKIKGSPEAIQTFTRLKPQRQQVKSLVEPLKELTYVEPLPGGGIPLGRSTLGRALRSPTDVKTVQQIAEVMSRMPDSELTGKFGTLGYLRHVSAIGAGSVGLATHSVGDAAVAFAGLEAGMWTMAQIMAHPNGATLFLDFLKAPVGGARAYQLAGRINALIDSGDGGDSMRVPPMPEQPTVTVEESHK